MLCHTFRASRIVVAVLSLVIVAPGILAQGEPTLSVFPSLAPNVFGSPSFTPWENNAISALQNGLSSTGSSALPSYYQQIANGALIPAWTATEFNSWKNDANPGSTHGPAFASELGNRLYFNLHITGNGLRFSLSQLSFQATSSDAGNFLGFSVTAGSYNYGSGFLGLDYVDGIKGNGNDLLITGGANTQLIDELFARGSGNAPAVLNSDPGATNQDKINNALQSLPGMFTFTGDYTLTVGQSNFNSSAFVVVGVPEPSTIIMTGCGAVAIGVACIQLHKKRRKRRVRAQTPVAGV